MGASYLKTEGQTIWGRNAARKQKMPAEDTAPSPDQRCESVSNYARFAANAEPFWRRRGSQVIVIHPGSRWLNIGKASEVTPFSIPNVIARKHEPPVPEPIFVEGVMRPRKSRHSTTSIPQPSNGDEYAVAPASDDPVRRLTDL